MILLLMKESARRDGVREGVKFQLCMLADGERRGLAVVRELANAVRTPRMKALLRYYEEVLQERGKRIDRALRALGFKRGEGTCSRTVRFCQEARDLVRRGFPVDLFEAALLIHLRERARDEANAFSDARLNSQQLQLHTVSELLREAEILSEGWSGALKAFGEPHGIERGPVPIL